MNAKYKNRKVHYYGEDYEFVFKDEKHHNHNHSIITPSHLKILSNTTELTLAQLKKHIIEEWFEDENATARLHNNHVTKKRRQKKKRPLTLESAAP